MHDRLCCVKWSCKCNSRFWDRPLIFEVWFPRNWRQKGKIVSLPRGRLPNWARGNEDLHKSNEKRQQWALVLFGANSFRASIGRRTANVQMKGIEQCFSVVLRCARWFLLLSLWLRSTSVAAQMKLDHYAVIYCGVVYCATFRVGG